MSLAVASNRTDNMLPIHPLSELLATSLIEAQSGPVLQRMLRLLANEHAMPVPRVGELVPHPGVQRNEDARASHPCERGAGLLRSSSNPQETGVAKIPVLPRRTFLWRCVMSIEPGPSPQNDFGSLQGCFVEGSAEQRSRERRIRRRALIISITAQSAILTAVILFPLFGKPERIALAMTPIPPYFHNPGPSHPPSDPRQPIQHNQHFFNDPISVPNSIPPHVPNGPVGEPQDPPDFPTGSGPGAPCPACIPIDDGRRQPDRPAEVRPQTPHRLFV